MDTDQTKFEVGDIVKSAFATFLLLSVKDFKHEDKLYVGLCIGATVPSWVGMLNNKKEMSTWYLSSFFKKVA